MNKFKSYEDISSLILSLSSNEINILKKYIVTFDKTITGKESKIIILINHIIKKQGGNVNQIYLRLYPNKNIKAFRVLCYYLRDKILETLILDVNIKRKGQSSAYGRAYIKTCKLLMQLRVCFTKGQGEIALVLMSKIKVIGDKYGFYDEVIQVLYLEQRLQSNKYGSRKSDKINDKIKKYEYLRDSLNIANQYLSKLQTETAFKNSLSKKLVFFNKTIFDLEKRWKRTQSKELYYQKEWLKVLYFQESKNYKKSNKVGIDLLNYIKKEDSVYKAFREGGVLFNLAYNNIFLNKLTLSLSQANTAIHFFPKYSHIYFIAQEVRFYAFFYSNQLSNAFKLTKEVCLNKKSEITKFQESKWRYWLAICYFNMSNYKEAQNELEKTQELKKDSEGWDISIRVLSIVCSIELDSLKEATSKISALKINYYRKPKVKVRLKTILSILISLEDSFEFKRVYNKHIEDVNKLNSNKGWYKWDVKTPELFLFDQWLTSKVNNKEYNPDYKELLKSK